MTDAVDKFGRPSIISLPTSANFVDKQAQVMSQALQGLQNADQMEQYLQFRKQALKGHTETNTVPMPGQIGSAYVSQPLSKEIRNFYGNEINKVMSSEFTSPQPTRTTPVPVSTPEVRVLPPLAPEQTPPAVATPIPAQAVAPTQAPVQAPAQVAAPAPVQAAVPPPAPAPAPTPTPAPAKAPAAKAPAKAASLPKGVPAGSVDTGKYSKDGKKVYRDRSGQLHTGD
jgi:hypothetical protein